MKLIRQIWYIALNSLKRRYAATRLGLVWAAIQPAMMFGVFWFVSVYGLRISAGEGPPYYAVLFCSLMPWMTLSATVSENTVIIKSHRHLLNSHSFPPMALPVAVAVENGIVQTVLLLIVTVILIWNGISPTLSWLAIIYWAGCLLVFSNAIGLIISVLALRAGDDATQAINLILLIWFWGSPIVWRPENMPNNLLIWLKLNPFFYISEGYSGAILQAQAHAPSLSQATIFWVQVILITSLGVLLFRLNDNSIREWAQ